MEEKFTKSYAIKRIAELTEEITRLNKQIKFLENEHKIRINSYKEYYERIIDKKIEAFLNEPRNWRVCYCKIVEPVITKEKEKC